MIANLLRGDCTIEKHDTLINKTKVDGFLLFLFIDKNKKSDGCLKILR